MEPLTLEELGFTESLRALVPAELEAARVTSVYAARVDVLTAGGPRHAIVRGKALRDAKALGGIAVGDWVTVRMPPAEPGAAGDRERELALEAILPRRTAFVRQAAGERAEPQAIAANIDLVLVATSFDGDFNVRRLERYLVAVKSSGASVLILVCKADLAEADDPRHAEAHALGETLLVSVRSGQGLDALRARIGRGQTAALVGSSGVGKSALVNALLGQTTQLEGEVRAHDRRGRHTTTKRSLFVLPSGGLLVDSPGMRELKPWQPDGDDDDDAFEDVAAVAEACRYRDCKHTTEPGCAVRKAVASGALTDVRLASFLKLARERGERADRQAAHATDQERRARAATITLRQRLRDKGR